MYSLFPIMALERTSFTVLNLFIALIVNSMQALQSESDTRIQAEAVAAHDEREALSRRIDALTEEIRQMRRAFDRG